jgi:hypothetical protein
LRFCSAPSADQFAGSGNNAIFRDIAANRVLVRWPSVITKRGICIDKSAGIRRSAWGRSRVEENRRAILERALPWNQSVRQVAADSRAMPNGCPP